MPTRTRHLPSLPPPPVAAPRELAPRRPPRPSRLLARPQEERREPREAEDGERREQAPREEDRPLEAGDHGTASVQAERREMPARVSTLPSPLLTDLLIVTRSRLRLR